MTREQKVMKFWAKFRGGHIIHIGNGIHLLTSLPIEYLGLSWDASKLGIQSNGVSRRIHNLYFTIVDNRCLENILQGIVIGDGLFVVDNVECIAQGSTNAGWTGQYIIDCHEIYINRKR